MLAWRFAPKIPEPILREVANIAADIAWLKRGKAIRRLESNYAKVRPELTEKQIRQLSRKGMRSYLRYFREAFTLPAVTADQLAARVRAENTDLVYDALAKYGSPVAALGHAGNWDLAGAWAAVHLVPVLTVAEKLKPEEIYQAFVGFRQSLGIEVLGLGDKGVFDKLVAGGKGGGRLIPLLADRDLTYRGVEVDLLGHKARVAAGPATVALAANVPLLLATIHYEKLHGDRRKAAGTPYGIVITFTQISQPVIPQQVANATQSADRAAAGGQACAEPQTVQDLTQAWVNKYGEFLKQHTEDWHMLQAVFVEDLDADKYAETLRKANVADSEILRSSSLRPSPQNDTMV